MAGPPGTLRERWQLVNDSILRPLGMGINRYMVLPAAPLESIPPDIRASMYPERTNFARRALDTTVGVGAWAALQWLPMVLAKALGIGPPPMPPGGVPRTVQSVMPLAMPTVATNPWLVPAAVASIPLIAAAVSPTQRQRLEQGASGLQRGWDWLGRNAPLSVPAVTRWLAGQ